MENSYKFENNPTASIDIPKEPSSVFDNQKPSKMSLPVNLNIASPMIRSV
jgi:hypothetical protein